MQTKLHRQRKILELIEVQTLHTQAALKDALTVAGFDVNQATLSRDMRELELVKVAAEGGYRYMSRSQSFASNGQVLLAGVRSFIQAIDHAGNIVVVKTDDGAAAHVAAAFDGMEFTGVLGSVAGDNTLLLIVKNGFEPAKVVEELRTVAQLSAN